MKAISNQIRDEIIHQIGLQVVSQVSNQVRTQVGSQVLLSSHLWSQIKVHIINQVID